MYDIEGFVTRQFVDYKYYGNPATDVSICCPFCEGRGTGEDTKFHLQIHLDPAKPVVHCFRCGYARSWIYFVSDITGFPYWRAIGELYVKPHIRDIKGKITQLYEDQPAVKQKRFSLPDDFQLLHKAGAMHSHLALVAKHYIKSRGFSRKVYEQYNLGIAESVGYRVIIPIERDYWQGRAIYKWIIPKYLNPKEPARDILFNAEALDLFSEIVICEGAFSAMAVGNNAIALISKEPTKEKLERILDSKVKTFIIALEYGAFGTMGKLTDTLRRNGRKVIVWKYTTGDPAEGSPFVELDYDLKAKISLMLDS